MSRTVKLETDFNNLVVVPVRYFLAGSAAATAANHPLNLFTAPFPCQVVSVVARFGTASTSGTLDIKKAASGTATSSGTSVMTGTISLAGTANTNAAGTMDGTNSILATGDTIGAIAAGTLTNLVDLGVTIIVKPLR